MPSLRVALPGALLNDRQKAKRLVPVSRETERRFDIYVDLLARWRQTTNLISESTFPAVWTRHIADSAQLLALAPDARRWVDMGSGAGFPGLVIAIQLIGDAGAVVHCIESDRKKCAFLRDVVRATGAPAVIHAARVEAIDQTALGTVDAVTARAFAPLPRTLELANLWLEQGAFGIFPRGRTADNQRETLPDPSRYSIERFPSVTDAAAVILRIATHQRAAA